MPRKLPPGEAARRRAERARATWAGERYRRYDHADAPGSTAQWSGHAGAFVRGHVELQHDQPDRSRTAMPDTAEAVKARWRADALALRNKFGSDTAPGYATEFQALVTEYRRALRALR